MLCVKDFAQPLSTCFGPDILGDGCNYLEYIGMASKLGFSLLRKVLKQDTFFPPFFASFVEYVEVQVGL